MYQGETITVTIAGLPFPTSYIRLVRIVFHTATKTILEKAVDDCIIGEDYIQCTLTQKDTLAFPCGPIQQSVIIICNDGSRFERDEGVIIVNKTSKREVML